MKLSVVIPVYCVEQTLQRCVESVLHQDIDDMEVILVDDGSPDYCPQLCDEWAEKDKRIQVIHKENGGLSDARNAGIVMSTGDYITFVDSDDWIADNTYLPLLQILKDHPEYDILEFPATTYHIADAVYTKTEDYWLQGEAYRHTYAWNKIYRRQLFGTVRYPVGRVFEDMYILPQLLEHCHVVATSDKGLYHYIKNENGITMQANGKQIGMLLEGLILVMNSMSDTPDCKERQLLFLHTLNIQLETFSKKGPVLLKPYTGHLPLRRDYSLPFNIKILMYHLFGIQRLCKIYNILNLLILHR